MSEQLIPPDIASINSILQSWTKACKQIYKIKQNRFLYGMFHSWFFASF